MILFFLFLLLSATSLCVRALSECRNGREAWTPPLWRLQRSGRTVALVLAVAPLDIPDERASDAFEAAASVSTAVHFMQAVDAPAVDCTVSPQSDARIAALVARLQMALTANAFNELFAQWQTTPLAVLAHRFSVFASVLWSVGTANQSDVSVVLGDSQLEPSTFAQRLINDTLTVSSNVREPLESLRDVCISTVEPYETPLIKQAALDAALPELESVVFRGALPPRAARNALLSQAYRCGDVAELTRVYGQIGTALWHTPLAGDAASLLLELRLYARNRRVAGAIRDVVGNATVSGAKPLFIVDAANMLAGDAQRTLLAELERSGFRLRAVAPGTVGQTDAVATLPLPGSDPNTVVYSVVGVAIFFLIAGIAVAVWFTLKRRKMLR
jgi:hypothetical protein